MNEAAQMLGRRGAAKRVNLDKVPRWSLDEFNERDDYVERHRKARTTKERGALYAQRTSLEGLIFAKAKALLRCRIKPKRVESFNHQLTDYALAVQNADATLEWMLRPDAFGGLLTRDEATYIAAIWWIKVNDLSWEFGERAFWHPGHREQVRPQILALLA